MFVRVQGTDASTQSGLNRRECVISQKNGNPRHLIQQFHDGKRECPGLLFYLNEVKEIDS